jgi:hypothetical protein
MKLFQESETLEAFERSLNDESTRINNLDLNGDNLIDYITINDYVDGNVHTIVLRVAMGRNDFQDVAVFTVEKFRDGSVNIQLIGDEALYGRNYIIEPIYEETPNPGYVGRPRYRNNITVVYTTPYEVAYWPLIRFIFLPDYVVWHSRWYWGYYPSYWNPWRPYYWHYYYGYHYHWYHHYYAHFHHWHYPRYSRYNDFYYSSVRIFSPQVNIRINRGDYRATYSRPEQRRDGEAVFTKLHPSQTRRTAENTINRSLERRTYSQTTAGRSSSGTGTDAARRSSSTPVSRSSSGQSASQPGGTARRSATSSGSQPAVRSSASQNSQVERRTAPASGQPSVRSSASQNSQVARRSTAPTGNQNSQAARRSTTPSASRPSANAPSARSSDVSRRSAPAVSSRSASRPQPAQSSQSARSSRPSNPGSGSSARSSSRGSSSSQSSKSKESESRSSRR